jgi:cation/acetate symporter
VIKATLLVMTAVLMTVFLLGKFGFSMSALLEEAAAHNADGQQVIEPGAQYGHTQLDFISLSLALVFGAAGLPHVLMRFYTVPDAGQARRSVVWAIGCMAVFYLATLVIGYGASALVGSDRILSSTGKENSAAPLLAFEIGGTLLLGIVAAVAFATIIAVVAGLTLTASASFAHDVYANIFRGGKAEPAAEVRVARLTAVVVGLLAMIGGVLLIGQNVAFLVALAFAFAASANLSTLLFSLFWRRFNTRGTLWGMYGGLSSCLLLVFFSPVVSGAPTSIFPEADFHVFPLTNPGIVSIPLSFLFAYLGTVFSKEQVDEAKQKEMAVRALTGIHR